MRIFFLTILAVVLVSCNKTKKQAKKDNEIITNYITKHNLDAIKTESGLYYVINEEGTGEYPTISSEVTVAYKGYLTDNTVFDESDTTGITFSLTSVIKGWQEGIPYFKPGGKGVLLIPSALGYGRRTQTNIPANSVLIFDIHLIE